MNICTPQNKTTKFKRILMWIVLSAIGLPALLSVIGAFYGAQKSKLIFNSIPLGFYWYGFALLFVAGFVEFPRLLRKPGLLMVHAGCLLILGGSMWGSEAGHRLAKRFFGIQKIPNGYMLISKGDSEKYITTEDFSQRLGELPFSIKLKDFRLEYYQTDEKTDSRLDIKTQEGRQFQLAAKPGEEISLGQGKLKVVRTFTNFKLRIEDNKKIITDEVPQGENPAVEVSIETPDGNSYSRFVFERFAGFSHGEDGLELNYTSGGPQMIRDYFSDLAVVKDGNEVVHKTIEVNYPLHYGGYHFYQHSYDSQMQKYTVLSVTSDSGLYTVYAGYWMLVVGALWQFWLRHIFKGKKDK